MSLEVGGRQSVLQRARSLEKWEDLGWEAYLMSISSFVCRSLTTSRIHGGGVIGRRSYGIMSSVCGSSPSCEP